MPPITRIALLALERQGGPRTVLAAVPGGIRSVAERAGVSPARVSQVLRQKRLPQSWAELLAALIGCSPLDVYQQLEQEPPVSRFGPLFDQKD